jgi:ATP-dependent DNA helicase RecG
MEVLFFNGTYLLPQFKTGLSFRFFGKVKCEYGRVSMFHPSYARSDGEVQEGILPVYPLTRGLVQKDVRHLSAAALEMAGDIPETLPVAAISSANLCGIDYAYRNIHYPEGDDQFRAARYRLVYEELFYLDTALALSRTRGGKGRKGRSFDISAAKEFTDRLPYKLTNAQSRALSEILSDMNSDKAMNRLVQGDVGSGKTAVAAALIYYAKMCGRQSALMAPTEVLAVQHYHGLSPLFEKLGIKVALLTGSASASEKKRIKESVESGDTDVLIGTHAIIQKDVFFDKLSLVIVDEQHRFGVNQRNLLTQKGENPHTLIMSATPIPRTMALILYGDLDVSVIDELPAGRQKVSSFVVNTQSHEKMYSFLREEVLKGRQAYVVCPLIEENDESETASVVEFSQQLAEKYLRYINIAYLHGKMPAKEKDDVLKRFASGEISVLVSTTVIEVGINVPNATVMIIENAEKFGLSQLHQLRGRVGRGSKKSWCFLVTDMQGQTLERLENFCKTNDGFEISRQDLELRGPGDLFGARQHGLTGLKLASLADMRSLTDAQNIAAEITSQKDWYTLPEYSGIAEAVVRLFGRTTVI